MQHSQSQTNNKSGKILFSGEDTHGKDEQEFGQANENAGRLTDQMPADQLPNLSELQIKKTKSTNVPTKPKNRLSSNEQSSKPDSSSPSDLKKVSSLSNKSAVAKEKSDKGTKTNARLPPKNQSLGESHAANSKEHDCEYRS